MSITTTPAYKPGLEGVIAAETRLSSVDGARGELIIGGYPVEVIAGKATYEEVVYLLWYDKLPAASELESFSAGLRPRRTLTPATLDLLAAAAAERLPVMDALRMGVASLGLGQRRGDGIDPVVEDGLRAIAASSTIVAAYWRLLNGQKPLDPDPALSHAANYLYMLTGEKPGEARIRGLETYLNTVIDHSLNASTFTARVIISTQSDMLSAITGAVGALKGPLHGGAPGPALDMVFEIGSIERAESYLRDKLSRGERLMGFGHRVYKVRDPRADVLSAAAESFFGEDGDRALFDLVKGVEKEALRLLEEFKPGRKLQTNVEFYTALLLHGLGLDSDLFAPTFAVSRVGGWTAHCLEQLNANRLIRPGSIYVGDHHTEWPPIESR